LHRADHFDALGLVALLLFRCLHRDDRDAIDVELGIGPHDIADLGAGEQEVRRDLTLRLPRTRGAPGPRAVSAFAGQLDVDPAGHRERTLLASRKRRRKTYAPPVPT